MKPLAIALLAILAGAPLPSKEACHFSVDHPIVCTQGMSAAVAWQRFGDDDAEIFQSYNQRILNSAGCETPYYPPASEKAGIELVNHGRSATNTGWVPISVITVDGKDLWYIASAYLKGVCIKHKPEVIQYSGSN